MTPAQNTAAYIQGFEDGKRTAKAEFATILAEQPPQRKRLTDEKIKDGYNEVEWTHAPSAHWFEAGVKFSEAAHGIKE